MEARERHDKGCYICDVKFMLGHKHKVQKWFLMEGNWHKDVSNELDGDIIKEKGLWGKSRLTNKPTWNLFTCYSGHLHTSGNENHWPFGQISIMVSVDSRSAQKFPDPSIAPKAGLSVITETVWR